MNNVRFFNAVFFCDLMPVNAKSISDIPETVASFNLDFCAFCRNFFSSCKVTQFLIHGRYPCVLINVYITINRGFQAFKSNLIVSRFCGSSVNCLPKLFRQGGSDTLVHRIVRVCQYTLHFFTSALHNLVCVVLPCRIFVSCCRPNLDSFIESIHKRLRDCLTAFSVLIDKALH